MTKPHDFFAIITPDQVAETWDGVIAVDGLYEALWACVDKYDNSHMANIEDIGPHDVIGINAVKLFWKDLEPFHDELNRLAVENDP